MPHPLRDVVAATDFSAGAQAAIHRAAIQVADVQAALRLMHVVERDAFTALRDLLAPGRDLQAAMVEQARMQLEALAAAIASAYGVLPRILLREGLALDELCAAAESAELLVVGACGSHPVREFTFGKTADRLARLSARPLLVVRRPADQLYQRVLVPVDFFEHSREALVAALALAPRASVQLLHCIELPFEGRMRLAGATEEELAQYRVDLRLQAVDRLRAVAHEFRGQGNIAASIVRAGDVRFELTRVVQQEHIDLVAIGRQGRGLLGHALLGSVTAWTLEHADCDVLVAPAAAVKGRP